MYPWGRGRSPPVRLWRTRWLPVGNRGTRSGRRGEGFQEIDRRIFLSHPLFLLGATNRRRKHCVKVKWSVTIVSGVYVLDRDGGIERSERNVTRKNEGGFLR